MELPGRSGSGDFFSLLDHVILNPENAVRDALANPLWKHAGFLLFLASGQWRRGLFRLVVADFSGCFFFYTFAFFRDPDRPVPADPNLIVARG